MRGDLLFYAPHHRGFTGWIERLIAHFTHGPFCHVAVDLGDGTKIEARTRGIVRVAVDGQEMARFPLSQRCAAANLEAALRWASLQVGKHYGWEDILNQVLKLCGSPVFLVERGRYDCSDLVAHVCAEAGLFDGHELIDLHLLSPNDLAYAVGLLKE